MVALFASLKWRLVTSRLRRTKGAVRVWTFVGMAVALAALLLIAFGLTRLRESPDTAALVVTGIFAVQLLAWAMLPLVAFGVDETVDPQRFALLPLRPQTLQRGLLVTAIVGYLPVANAIVLIGAAIALSNPWWLLPISLLVAALQMLICVVLSRAIASAMSALMSSRRGRDLGILVGFLLVVLYVTLSTSLNGGSGNFIANGAGRVARILAWTPPGGLATLPGRLAAGEYGLAAAGLAIALVGFGLVWWWWGRSLVHRLTTVPSSTESSSPAGSSGLTRGASVATTTFGTAQLVGRRDLILAWRDPMRRLPWLVVLFMAIFWPLLVFRGGAEGFAPYAVALGSLLAGSTAANQYGLEGSALWLHLVAFADRTRARGEVLGHAAAAIVPGAAAVVVALVTVTAVRGGWAQLPAAAGVCFAALVGSCAIASYLSASLPFAMPQSRKSLFMSSVPGQKGRTSGAQIGVLLGGLAAAIPAAGIALLAETQGQDWGWLGLLVGLATGAIMLMILSRKAAARFLESGPEILATVSVGDRI